MVNPLCSESVRLDPSQESCRIFSQNLTLNSFFFFLFAFNRTHNDHLSLSRERNVANPAYQRYQGKQLQRFSIESLGNGLADWFVIKHTKDQALLRYLLSKYGFKAADATQVGISKNKEKLLFYCVCLQGYNSTNTRCQVITRGNSMVFPS